MNLENVLHLVNAVPFQGWKNIQSLFAESFFSDSCIKGRRWLFSSRSVHRAINALASHFTFYLYGLQDVFNYFILLTFGNILHFVSMSGVSTLTIHLLFSQTVTQMLMAYLARLTVIADNKINCGPALTWMEVRTLILQPAWVLLQSCL